MAVCESCIAAAEEEGVPEGEEDTIMRDMGGEIADHLCDQIESDGDIQCACACHPRKRGAKKSMVGIDHDGISEVYHKVYG